MDFSRKFLVLMAVFMAALILSAGCTATDSSAPKDAGIAEEKITEVSTPNLVGIWTGNLVGHHESRGFIDSPTGSWELNITEQNGQVFTGTKTYTKSDGETFIEDFSGAISYDGETIYIVDHDDGTAYCSLISPDELEIIYLSDDSDSAHVFVIDLVRQ